VRGQADVDCRLILMFILDSHCHLMPSSTTQPAFQWKMVFLTCALTNDYLSGNIRVNYGGSALQRALAIQALSSG